MKARSLTFIFAFSEDFCEQHLIFRHLMTCYRLRDGTEYISRLLGSVWHRVHAFAPVQVPHSGTKSRLPRFRGAAHVHLPLAVRGELSGPAAQQHAALAAAHRARQRVAHCERAPRAEARHGPRELRHSGNRTINLGGMCEVSRLEQHHDHPHSKKAGLPAPHDVRGSSKPPNRSHPASCAARRSTSGSQARHTGT